MRSRSLPRYEAARWRPRFGRSLVRRPRRLVHRARRPRRLVHRANSTRRPSRACSCRPRTSRRCCRSATGSARSADPRERVLDRPLPARAAGVATSVLDGEALRALRLATLNQLPHMNPWSLANVCYALAQLRVGADRPAWDGIWELAAQVLAEKADELAPQGISNVAWAFVSQECTRRRPSSGSPPRRCAGWRSPPRATTSRRRRSRPSRGRLRRSTRRATAPRPSGGSARCSASRRRSLTRCATAPLRYCAKRRAPTTSGGRSCARRRTSSTCRTSRRWRGRLPSSAAPTLRSSNSSSAQRCRSWK